MARGPTEDIHADKAALNESSESGIQTTVGNCEDFRASYLRERFVEEYISQDTYWQAVEKLTSMY